MLYNLALFMFLNSFSPLNQVHMCDVMTTLEILRKRSKTQCKVQLPHKEQNCPYNDMIEAMDLREQGSRD